MLDFAILGVLHEAPMHGYELRKRLTALLGAFRAFSYGSLYPTLRRMQRAGWIVEESEENRRGGTRVRRARRVYKITAEGKERFAELIAEAGPQTYEDDGFGVHLAFFSRTPAEVRMRILEGRRRRVEERREGLRAALARAGEQIDRYTRELHRMGLETSEREVRWLNELIAHEQAESRTKQPNHDDEGNPDHG
jgi:DNA-binding PadR family transcriptional regulator